jgi:hypothetical protein
VVLVERWAHARFRVIRINRWSIALLLLAALALLLLPGSSFLQASSSPSRRVRQGVTLLNRDFSGRSEPEVRVMLKEMGYESAPVSAEEKRGADGVSYVIPEVNGYKLDEDQTWTRLALAAEGTRVQPAARVYTPTKRLADYPNSIIRQGNAQKQAVGLLINVDWGTKELRPMLVALKKRGAKATFFVSGRWADDNKQLLKLMADDGHEIATHGYSLQFGPSVLARAGKLKDDIAKSVSAIQNVTGTKVAYYAPHMSETDPPIIQAATELKLRTVLYSVDTVDWRDATSGQMILTQIGQAVPGDLILMHPKPNTAKVLEAALIGLQGKGLHPMTLSEMLSPEPESPASAYEHQHDPGL